MKNLYVINIEEGSYDDFNRIEICVVSSEEEAIYLCEKANKISEELSSAYNKLPTPNPTKEDIEKYVTEKNKIRKPFIDEMDALFQGVEHRLSCNQTYYGYFEIPWLKSNN